MKQAAYLETIKMLGYRGKNKKRANRIKDCLPNDWGDGYENVLLQVTTENQTRADERLPILLDIPAKHKGFMAAPFIGEVDAEKYLAR